MTPTCDGDATLLSRAACEDAAGTCDQGGHTTRAACEASNGGAGVYTPAVEYASETVASAELGKIIGVETGYDGLNADCPGARSQFGYGPVRQGNFTHDVRNRKSATI
jgi:hypothetical protein